MKRYQNPDVFEPLAMAYALGTLQGRARARFEKLMSRHFYLRVVAEAYEHQFAGLAGLLPPEEPSPDVWKRLEVELNLSNVGSAPEKAKKRFSLSEWLHWPAMAFASVLAAVVTVFVMNGASPDAYFANMKSLFSDEVAMATVSKEEMAITIAMAGQLKIADGLQPTLWCLPKNKGEKAHMMGAVNASGQTQLPIDTAIWQGMENIGKFAITLEPVGAAKPSQPSGEMVFEGELMRGNE